MPFGRSLFANQLLLCCSLLFSTANWRWMIRNRFDLGLIHSWLATCIGSAGRNNPKLGYLAGSSSGAGFDTIWIDAFVVREIEIGIDRTFGVEVLPFLVRIFRTDDHQPGIRFA